MDYLIEKQQALESRCDNQALKLYVNSRGSRIEIGKGQGAKCLVMVLCLGLGGGQRSCLVHILIRERRKIGAGGHGPRGPPGSATGKSVTK